MSLVEKAAQRLREQSDQRAPTHGTHKSTAPDAPDDVLSRPAQTVAQGGEPLVLNINELQRAGLVPPEGMRAKIGREYQRVKRPLLQVMAEEPDPDRRMNRLMITSAKPGEGKSFTSINLALSLAQELDHSVLLVDGDVVSPRLSRALGVGEAPGLTDTLLDTTLAAEQTVRPTNIPRLSFMSAGQRHDQATELMASRRMRQLVDALAGDPHRIVIFDSAPLLATAESQALALNVGQIVFVVKASHTERSALDSALSLIDPSDKRVSLVLNQSRAGFGDGYDGYYGSYGGGANGASQV